MGFNATHHFIFVPHKEASRVLLLLHGTGGSESDLLGLGRELDPTAALLSPRGKVLENGMPRFFRRLAEGVFDEEDIRFRGQELAGFVREARREFDVEHTTLTAVGYSNGANIASALLLLHPEILDSAVLIRPMVPLVPPLPPDLSKKRILLLGGRADPIAPPQEVTRLASLFDSYGAQTETVTQNASHGLVSEDIERAKKWLQAS